MDIGILGGGISGLVLASQLQTKAEVLEASETPGGLAKTFGDGGFLSDIGGHIVFAKDQEALDLMVRALGENCDKRRRANVILYDGAFVKYPFENGLSQLPKKEDTLACVEGFVRAWAAAQIPDPDRKPPKDLGEWCQRLFGPGLSDKYLIPYNRKIWKRPVEEISTEWVDRVPMPNLQEILQSAIGIETEGYVHQLYFFYPKTGGIESLAKAFAKQVTDKGHTLTLGYRATKLAKDAATGDWLVSNADGKGDKRFHTLVSTVPILPLLEMLAEVPEPVMTAARGLKYNSLRIVLLGVDKPAVDPFTAVYVPDERSIYHRVCFNNAFSMKMAPEGMQSISVEITCKEGDEIFDLTDEQLSTRVIDDLERDKLISRSDVRMTKVHREKFAYVVYDHGYTDRVRTVRDWLASQRIHLAGRFAEFRYVNMDACVRRAIDLAKELDAS